MQLNLHEEKVMAVKVLKEKYITLPILALPRADGQYSIDTDDCDTQVWCVLVQKQEDKVLKPLDY